MDKYIKELLNLKNSVVLPEVGGLLKIGNNISINEYLKFNDGKLVAYLSEQKNIDSEEALKEVEAFCEEVKNKLEAEGEYTIKKLGVIKLIDGKLSFEVKTPEEPVAEEKKEEASVKEKVEAPMGKKEKNEPVKEEPKEEEKPKKKIKQVIFSDSSADLSEEDALEAIRNIDNKEELIAFAENDKRDSVSSFFLERLTSFNELKEEKKKVKEKKEKAKKEETTEKNLVDKKKEKVEETKISKESEEKKVQKEEPAEKNVVNKKEGAVKEESVVETSNIKEETKADKKGTSEKKQEFIESKKESPDEISDETIEKIAEGAEKIETESKKRRKSRPFLWIGLVLIVSGVGILGYLKQEMIKGWFASGGVAEHTEDTKSNEISDKMTGKEDDQHVEDNSVADVNIEETTNVTEETVDQVEESVEEVITEEAEIVEEPVVEKQEPKEDVSTPVQSATNGSYHVIVGSFSNVSNAENLVKDLKAEGYSDAGILGKFGSLTSVKMGSYTSLDDAKSALQQSGKDGWIKKY